jgi:hypothetical protein
MLTELAKGLEALASSGVVVAVHQPLTTAFSDSPPGLPRTGAGVASLASVVSSAAGAVARLQLSYRAVLLRLPLLLRADQLQGP